MPSAPAPGAKSSSLDFKQALLNTFVINEKANHLLLDNIAAQAWEAPPPTGSGRSIADIAAHIHNVRLMWLAAADKSAKIPARLDADKASRDDIQAGLKASAVGIQALIRKVLADPAGRVLN